MRLKSIWILCAAATWLFAIGGCGKSVITADDVILAPGQPAQFVMSLDRQIGKASVTGAEVEFRVEGRSVGRAKTDSNGVATVRADIEGRPTTYSVRARIDQEVVQSRGRIFHWDHRRTAVAVDVDDTISETDYGALFLTDLDTTSPHFEHSPQAVQAMASHFTIVYLSARPRWLHEKTKVWLDAHGFPPGPILHASRFEACFHQERYKREMLAEFQQSFPNLLIGVGDKTVDDLAYGHNRMLAVILEKQSDGYRDHCVVLPDWRRVEEFFIEHRESLANASRLQRFIHASNMNLRSYFEPSESYLSAAAGSQEPDTPVQPAAATGRVSSAAPPAVAAPTSSRRPTPVAKAPKAHSEPDRTANRGGWIYGYQ
jgi:hypothetical protein